MRWRTGPLALAVLAVVSTSPANAWMRGGETAEGGHYGAAASDGHWAAGANGHAASGTYGTSSNGTHYATTAKGGSAEAGGGSWSSQSASGKTNGGSYGTTGNGTHYATGSYGGGVAANNGHVAAAGPNGQYAYGTHYTGTTAYGGAYHPPVVVNQYYGTGCYNCGGWNAGAAVAAGAVAGAVVANAVVAARPPPVGVVYAPGDVYSALPSGCAARVAGGMVYYACGSTWFSPAYGANGTYYRVVAPP